ncbi:MAG: YHS domain-containing (seleno)protein [Bacteroidota bacterium]
MRKALVLAVLAFGVLLRPAVNAEDKTSAKKDVALQGYCPVAYFAMGKPIEGDPDLTYKYDGQIFNLANEKAFSMFKKDPAKFAPRYHGYCATATAMGKKMESDPQQFLVFDEALYLFSTEEAKVMFEKDEKGFVAKADKMWAQKSEK